MQKNLHVGTPTRFVNVGSVRMAYRQFGEPSKTSLVFLQHFTGTMDNWDPVLTNRLARDRTVILFDNIGIGRSGGATPNTVAAMAQDTIAFLDAMGLAEVDLFGFSLGGFVAQELIRQAPHRVRRLILAGTGPQGGEGMNAWSPRAVEIVSRPNTTFEERCLALFFAPTPNSQAAGKAWLDRVAERQMDREPPASAEVAASQLEAIQGWGEGRLDRQYLQSIRQPTLITNGKEDIMVPTVNSYLLQQEIPNAKLILYPDSGHAAQFQYSVDFAQQATTFLA